MKLTVNSTPGLRLPDGKSDHVFWDDDIAGFGLRLRGGGKRTWVFRYKLGRAKQLGSIKQRLLIFGTYPAMAVPAAREQAAKFHAEVKLGGDPAGDKEQKIAKASETFEAAMALYLERRRTEGLRATTYTGIERHLCRNLKPLHALPLSALDRRTIAAQLARLTTETGPVQANRTRASLVKFLELVCRRGVH